MTSPESPPGEAREKRADSEVRAAALTLPPEEAHLPYVRARILEEARSPEPKFLYVMSLNGMPRTFKVGVSVDPDRRAVQLSAASPWQLTVVRAWAFGEPDQAGLAERHAHYRLRALRLRGEWFGASSNTVLAAVKDAFRDVEQMVEAQKAKEAKLEVCALCHPEGDGMMTVAEAVCPCSRAECPSNAYECHRCGLRSPSGGRRVDRVDAWNSLQAIIRAGSTRGGPLVSETEDDDGAF